MIAKLELPNPRVWALSREVGLGRELRSQAQSEAGCNAEQFPPADFAPPAAVDSHQRPLARRASAHEACALVFAVLRRVQRRGESRITQPPLVLNHLASIGQQNARLT
jgi:hypothetical protein